MMGSDWSIKKAVLQNKKGPSRKGSLLRLFFVFSGHWRLPAVPKREMSGFALTVFSRLFPEFQNFIPKFPAILTVLPTKEA